MFSCTILSVHLGLLSFVFILKSKLLFSCSYTFHVCPFVFGFLRCWSFPVTSQRYALWVIPSGKVCRNAGLWKVCMKDAKRTTIWQQHRNSSSLHLSLFSFFPVLSLHVVSNSFGIRVNYSLRFIIFKKNFSFQLLDQTQHVYIQSHLSIDFVSNMQYYV